MKQEATTPTLVEQNLETPFYIPADGSSTRPRRTLKSGETFVVFDSHGDIGAVPGGPDGVFHNGTRFLSRFDLSINGEQPLVLGSNVRDDNTILNVDLTNPDMFAGERLLLQKDTLHIRRTIFLREGLVYARFSVRNYASAPTRCELSFDYSSDFADIFEVRGMRRKRRGRVVAKRADDQTVILNYLGLDHAPRKTSIAFDPAPNTITQTRAVYSFNVDPEERRVIFVVIACIEDKAPEQPSFLGGLRSTLRESNALARERTTIETSNEMLNKVLSRSIADLDMLMTPTPQGPYPYAGIPWYSTTFGRDGIITAIAMLWFDPSIARGVLNRLAAFQATRNDPAADAQPGKILHEMRAGEMAALNEIPFGLYYGSVDSTPLFVMLVGLYAERTGDMETVRRLWPHVRAGLAWIDTYGDIDGDGLIEYARATEEGLANQGWKDSQDSIFHADGSMAKGPIALSEVQGYVVEAKRLAAKCAKLLGDAEFAAKLSAEAHATAETVEAKFWCEDIQSYAIAIDGAKAQCKVRSSNAGHLLFCGLARPDRAAVIAKDFLSPRFFSGWGIRTIPVGEALYNPMSYHNGSVWPHDNALIALGLARYGFSHLLEPVFRGMFDAAAYMDLQRLPELFCGFRRVPKQGPTLYPVACSPQAWAAATPLALFQASLGLSFNPWRREIELRNPCLPSFIDHAVVRNLQVGTAKVDLIVRRHADRVSVELGRTDGDVRILTTSFAQS
ncbi:amylo-alpha-1,6-glucosidase [Variibacter gotjawalensis]|uniref:Amylo-alpha-1,6-glucosidase n=1 Tax=Variibacter gotjawalensis TaxID=1333996 RepID=A0A0S3PSD3_9BRAD|nr:amylo-alpha-1,6-glucosidase [Variibacter gotjawalensis]NIK49165.1 glycogen debranching enzyme [Variibacter gotjawalensis]RZS51021.1 glycogen debranching enzyme [Variibacter gotjawalensis]BAT58855.1 amylo-alpha-1,6-glucosidase [Variibacter gotjawalensis]